MLGTLRPSVMATMALLRPRLLSPWVVLCFLALGTACQEPPPALASPAEATAEAETVGDLMSARREAMVRVVREDGRINDTKVLDAMLAVPREEFVLPEHRDRAYHNRPLPIKEGQTNLPALDRGTDDGAPGPGAGRPRAGDRDRLGIPGGGPGRDHRTRSIPWR